MKTFYTDYKTAAHWLDNNLVLCNNLPNIDASVLENMNWDNWLGEDDYPEIMQWYLTNLTDDDVRWLNKTFDLIFTYSELLDLWVLCVDHWGTDWSYVRCKVKSKGWATVNPELEFKH